MSFVGAVSETSPRLIAAVGTSAPVITKIRARRGTASAGDSSLASIARSSAKAGRLGNTYVQSMFPEKVKKVGAATAHSAK
ncbi:hypothetical protein D3C72_1933180 [compost metagenome]